MLGGRGRLIGAAIALMLATSAGLLAAETQGPAFRVVTIPALPSAPLCADEKAGLVARLAAAQADAAENAQIAARLFSERQLAAKDGRASAADIAKSVAERDKHLAEARRAFAALDGATRLEEKNCTPPAEVVVEKPAAPAAVTPTATSDQATPVEAVKKQPPTIALALKLEIPSVCKPGGSCPMAAEITNEGSKPLASPFLVAFALGGDQVQIGNVQPEAWTCGRANESLTCSGAGTALEPGAKTRLMIDWQIPERFRRPTATVCAKLVWPARAKDGVYRSEQIAAIQFALYKAGFDPGGYDGRLGSKTVEAIRAFRSRAGIEGPTELTGDFLNALFGSNGALSGDDKPGNDSACTSVSFGKDVIIASPVPESGAPIAVASAPPSPAIESAPVEPEQPRLAPKVATPAPVKKAEPRKRQQQAAIPIEPRRQSARRAPIIIDDDEEEDDVVVYTSPSRRGPVASGRPIIVYPDGSYRRWGDPNVRR